MPTIDGPELFIRRADDQRVAAMRYTGDNLDELRAFVGLGLHVVEAEPPRVYVGRDAAERGDQLLGGDWVVRDDERVYAVRSYAFRGHCREVAVE